LPLLYFRLIISLKSAFVCLFLGAPLFDNPPLEASPSVRGFIQHARVFFKRASIILEALDAKISKIYGKGF